MKVMAKPIEMIAWFTEDGASKPANGFCVEYREILISIEDLSLIWNLNFSSLLLIYNLYYLWEISANLKWVDPFLTSSPSRMIHSFIGLYNDGTIFRHIYVTCYETILGFSLGTVLGTIIAIILWWCPLTAKVLDPYLVVLNALPKIALAPIIIFWVGTGTSAIIIIALLISIVTTIISVFTGFKEIDKEKLLLMKTF